MSQVSSTRSDAPTRSARPAPQGQRAVPSDDVRAMSDAFAAARAKLKFAPAEGLPQKPGKAPLLGKDAGTERKATEAAAGAAFDRKVSERQQSERQADGQGLALPGQPAAAPPAVLVTMPNPQVDPGGFAQMLADLWTRENGKGAREVRVRFGEDAWPTTGATLIRNSAGTLDIAVSMDAAQGRTRDPSLAALGRELGNSGLAIGALAVDYE